MGNTIGGRKKVRVMKITGETLKIRTPVRAWDIIKDHPGHVLLESEAVKRFGVRAKPVEPQQDLESKKIYFLVQLPKFPEEKVPRRTRSIGGGGARMSAKDRLDCMLLSRRSVSDLSITRPAGAGLEPRGPESSSGPLRVKMRVPRAQLAKLVNESRDNADVAEKILDLFMGKKHGEEDEDEDQDQWQPGLGTIVESFRSREVSLK